MLKLTNIVKEYPTGDSKVVALKGVDIEFRENAALYDYPMSGIDTPLKRLLSTDIEAASAVVEELAAKLAQ